jgi:DNA-binding NtrC family response regulator
MGDELALSPADLAAARVMVVDDDSLVTTSIRNYLRLDLDLDPLVFNDPRRALAHLETHEVDLVISDFLMPGLDGIALLGEARRLQPEVPRVLLTGYADKESAIRAINEVQLFHYLEKPWDNAQLRSVVENALERLHLRRLLARKMQELADTRGDLDGLRRAVMRTFA